MEKPATAQAKEETTHICSATNIGAPAVLENFVRTYQQ
jgi:hypothetical protein